MNYKNTPKNSKNPITPIWPINILSQAVLNILNDIEKNNHKVRSKLRSFSQNSLNQNSAFETERTRDKLLNEKNVLLLKNNYESKINELKKNLNVYMEVIEKYNQTIVNQQQDEQKRFGLFKKRIAEMEAENVSLTNVCTAIQEKMESFKNKHAQAVNKNELYLQENAYLKSQINALLSQNLQLSHNNPAGDMPDLNSNQNNSNFDESVGLLGIARVDSPRFNEDEILKIPGVDKHFSNRPESASVNNSPRPTGSINRSNSVKSNSAKNSRPSSGILKNNAISTDQIQQQQRFSEQTPGLSDSKQVLFEIDNNKDNSGECNVANTSGNNNNNNNISKLLAEKANNLHKQFDLRTQSSSTSNLSDQNFYVNYPNGKNSKMMNNSSLSANYNHQKTINNFKKCNVNNFNFQNFHSATNLFYTHDTNLGNLKKNTTILGQKMAHLKEPSVPTKLYTVPDHQREVKLGSRGIGGNMSQSFNDIGMAGLKNISGQKKPTGIVCPKVVEMDINRNFHSSARILKKF